MEMNEYDLSSVNLKESLAKLEDDVLSHLLLLIYMAAENRDHQSVDVLTKAYQRIKSVQTI